MSRQQHGSRITKWKVKNRFRLLKDGEKADDAGKPFQLSSTQWYDPKTQKMYDTFEKQKGKLF